MHWSIWLQGQARGQHRPPPGGTLERTAPISSYHTVVARASTRPSAKPSSLITTSPRFGGHAESLRGLPWCWCPAVKPLALVESRQVRGSDREVPRQKTRCRCGLDGLECVPRPQTSSPGTRASAALLGLRASRACPWDPCESWRFSCGPRSSPEATTATPAPDMTIARYR